MRFTALLSATLVSLVAGAPYLFPRDVVSPSTDRFSAEDLSKPKSINHMYTAPPPGACGAADWIFSTAKTPYVKKNSFYWLYPKNTCQTVDLEAKDASSVNRILVDPSINGAVKTMCGSCSFYASNDCTGAVFGPIVPSADLVIAQSPGNTNTIGFNSWRCSPRV